MPILTKQNGGCDARNTATDQPTMNTSPEAWKKTLWGPFNWVNTKKRMATFLTEKPKAKTTGNQPTLFHLLGLRFFVCWDFPKPVPLGVPSTAHISRMFYWSTWQRGGEVSAMTGIYP